MRNKIKQIMNKEEGFTLVELLAVIVILGIIVAIAIPAVGSVISRAENNANEAEESLVIDAARLYTIENASGFTSDETKVKVEKLVDGGYLELRDSNINKASEVTITRNGNEEEGFTYEYTYEYQEASE